MPIITVGTTPINFPDTASSPDWSEAVILFAQTVASRLNTAVGEFDIATQEFSFSNTANGQNIDGLEFSSAAVRAAYINYTVFRESSVPTKATESGQILVINNNGIWEMAQEKIGNAEITLEINDSTGKVTITANNSTYNLVNKITFNAKTFSV